MANEDDSLNQAKIITVRAMYEEGFITQAQMAHFLKHYVIVQRKPGMWDKILEKYWGRPTGTNYEMVKVVCVDDNGMKALNLVETAGEVKPATAGSRFGSIETE